MSFEERPAVVKRMNGSGVGAEVEAAENAVVGLVGVELFLLSVDREGFVSGGELVSDYIG